MSGSLTGLSDRYEIPIQSRSVSRLFVQSGFDIQIFEDGAETTIRIQNPVAVVTENPRPLVRMEAEDAFMPVLGVYGKIVISGDALRSNEKMVDVVFHPGVHFWVEPRYTAESWGPYGSKGLIIVCMPGSEMAVWFGMRSASRVVAESGIQTEAVMLA